MKCPFCGTATLNLEQHIPYYHPELLKFYSENPHTKLQDEIDELRKILEDHIEPGVIGISDLPRDDPLRRSERG